MLNLIYITMAQTIKLTELKENKTFTLHINGRKFRYSYSSMTVNGVSSKVNTFYLDETAELTIESYIPGMWRVLRDGRKGYYFVPTKPSPFTWTVLLD